MMTKGPISIAAVAALGFLMSACAQTTPCSYKPHLSVLAEELSPSETPIDMSALQGMWKGAMTLLTDTSKHQSCSKSIALTWQVDGDEIDGTSLSPKGGSMDQRGSIDETGRWEATTRMKEGRKFHMSGWFADGKVIDFVRNGNEEDHCDYRIDLTKVG